MEIVFLLWAVLGAMFFAVYCDEHRDYGNTRRYMGGLFFAVWMPPAAVVAIAFIAITAEEPPSLNW